MDVPGLSDASNPMLNPVILERVFKLTEFDTKTFGIYRLVCKEWRDTSLPIWRGNALLPVACIDKGHAGVYVETYLQLLKAGSLELAKHPFKRYLINCWCGCIDFYQGEKPERRLFWTTVGPLMTHLHIKHSHFYHTHNLRQILFQWTPNLESLHLSKNYYRTDRHEDPAVRLDPGLPEHLKPEIVNKTLRELRVKIDHVEDMFGYKVILNKNDQILPITWMEFLVHFPNLKVFEPVHLSPFNCTTEMIEVLKTVEILRNSRGSHYLANLEELRLSKFERFPNDSPEITEEIVPLLRRLQFPLKVISLNLGEQTKEETLQQILEIHSETLEELILFTGKKALPYQNFPFGTFLPNLTKLKFSGNVVSNLRFLRQMPNLEILNVDQDEVRFTKLAELNANNVVLENMKEFLVKKKHFTDGQLASLGKLMPNLTKLHLGLENKSGLGTVCKVWKELRFLNLNPLNDRDNTFMDTANGIKYIESNIEHLKYLESFKVGTLVEYG